MEKKYQMFELNDRINHVFAQQYNGKFSVEEAINHSIMANNLDYDFSGKTCAIVGSAPNILDKKYGKEIDDHDFIIRSNAARIEGFEEWVGSRTDLRVVSGKTFSSVKFENEGSPFPSATWFPRLKGEHFLVRSTPYDIDRIFGVYDLHMNGKNRISYIHKDIEKYASQTAGSVEATTGFMSILVGVLLFGKVDIYGYSFYDGNSASSFPSTKYYCMSPIPCGGQVHSFNGELNATKQLQNQGLLKWHK